MTIALRPLSAALALAGAALLAAGCESTQDKSAKIAAELGPVQQEEGLKISRESREVEVRSATLLSDGSGAAVVVEVHNRSGRDLADVPIALDVLDARGRSVYSNDLPGLETALTAIPFVPAGGSGLWVHDQVLASGEPTDVEVTVGEGGTPYTGEVPRFEVGEAKLEGDPYSGVVADGNVENRSGEANERLLLYAVARRGGEVVAAGRGAIERIKPEPKPLPYNIYFIGDPRGAEVEVSAYPTLPGVEP